jgi:hypothetical protein
MVSFRAGMIARSAMADTTPPNTIRALPGAFRLDGMDANLVAPARTPPILLECGVGSFTITGEDMTTQTGYTMPAGTGAFELVDPGTTQMTPPALTLSLDGIVMGNSGGTSLVLPPLVTTKPNNIIVVTVRANSAPVTGVSGSTRGAFAQRGSGGSVFSFWIQAPLALAGETITITAPGSSYLSGRAFAVNGSKYSAPFDVNASCPTLTPYGAPADPANITVTSPNTLVYACWNMGGESDPAAGAGYTRIPTASNSDYTLHEYRIFTGSSGAKSVTIGSPGTSGSNQGFLDAIVAGP